MRQFLIALALSFAAISFSPAAQAQDTALPPAQEAEQRSTLLAATAVINYGRAKADPLAMLAGVQMMVSVEARIEDGSGKQMNLGAVLDEAVALANGDELVLARAATLRDDVDVTYRGACYWSYACDWYGYCSYWWYCY